MNQENDEKATPKVKEEIQDQEVASTHSAGNETNPVNAESTSSTDESEGKTEKPTEPTQEDISGKTEVDQNSETTSAETSPLPSEDPKNPSSEHEEKGRNEGESSAEKVDETHSEKAVPVKTDTDSKPESAVAKSESPTDQKPVEDKKSESPYPTEGDYSKASPEELVQILEGLLKKFEVQYLKKEAESVRRAFDALMSVDKKEKREAFIAGGGNEIDFVHDNPVKGQFYAFWDEYRARKARHTELLEKRLNDNLKQREALIEELKSLIESEEKMDETFDHFRKIQDEWRQAGPVPRVQADEVFKTFHFHVERFYDYVALNNELRDLDFKKNLSHKEALIKEANQLLKLENVHDAFRKLQLLHKRWKQEGGPVAKEDREPTWEKFSAVTHLIHEKRREAISEAKERNEKVMEGKKKAIQNMKELLKKVPKTHNQWQEAIKKSKAVMEEYKSAGHLPKPESDAVWEKMKEALHTFNHEKNEFYKHHKQELTENLNKLKEIANAAEELKDSEDWKETSNTLKGLQQDWKKIKPVPRKEADKIWKKFRGACNHFFDRLEGTIKENEAELEANLNAKKEYLEKLVERKMPEAKEEFLAMVKDIRKEWKALGNVPRKAVQEMESGFKKAIDGLFDAAKIKGADREAFHAKSKFDHYVQKGDFRGLRREIAELDKKRKFAEQELNKLETNIQFFTNSSKGANPLMKQAEAQIEKQRSFVEKLRRDESAARQALKSAEQENA